jgi:hypothetical protein
MKAGIKPSSLNTILRIVQSFLRYLKINDILICETMLEVRPLKTGESLPRDLSVSQVKALLQIVLNPMDRAMAQVEDLFDLHEKRRVLCTPAELVALLDSLSRGTLNESQRETVNSLRQGILSLAEVSV